MSITTEAAARLARARADRTAIPQLSGDIEGLDLATAYDVQAAERSSTPVGWKVGLTSRAKRAQVGVEGPIRGFLGSEHALDIGEPLITGEHIQPRCEPEIAFVMGHDLRGDHVTAADVLGATSTVAVAIDVLDSRYTDYRFTMPDVVADNASAGQFVIGSPRPLGDFDLRLVGVVFEKNGALVATASGAAALGHPAAAVAWLVRSLAAADEGLRAGDVIISGGLTVAVAVRPGDVVVATVDRLGTVELACR